MNKIILIISLILSTQSFASDCRYLDSLDEIYTIVSYHEGETIKMPARFLEDQWDPSCNVRVVEMTTSNEEKLIQLTTFEDECDGGNTYGYIIKNNLEGEVVVEIRDGDLYGCVK